MESLNLDVVILSIPIFFVLIAVELVYDLTKQRKSYRLNDAFANISCGVIDQMTGVFAKVFTIGAYVLVFELFRNWRGFEIPSNFVFWALCFVLVDFAYYWSHRLSHQINLFWVGHVVHHQSEEYNLSVALRQGAFQKMLMFWIYLPLAAAGFPPTWFAVSIGLNLLYQFWIHTEFIDRLGPLEWVLNTPSHHRVHHGRNPKYIDKNHAGVFIVWDRLFGTFQVEEERPTYGITTPLNSFNPVMAHIAPFKQLFSEAAQVPGWRDRFRFLFAAPGWYPPSMGGFKAPPELTGKEVKFNYELPLVVNAYLLSQYAVVIGFTSVFLFTFQNYSNAINAVFLVVVLFQVYALGSLFDRRTGARVLELIRQFVLLSAAVWVALTLEMQTFGVIIFGLTLVGLAGFIILWSKQKWSGKE